MQRNIASDHPPLEAGCTRRRVLTAGVAASLLTASTAAFPAAELKLGDNAGVTAGFGLRASYTNRERGAPNGTSDSNDFSVESVRIYLGGHYGNMIKGTFNTERTGGPRRERRR